jgi:hypothetical protein
MRGMAILHSTHTCRSDLVSMVKAENVLLPANAL